MACRMLLLIFMRQDSWEHFSHEADIGVRGRGHNKESAFEQAALALTGALVDPELVRPPLLDSH
mgnify:CR=1 FL=1